MKVLLQRVKQAEVRVNGEILGEISQGLLAFIGIEKNDNHALLNKMLTKLLSGVTIKGSSPDNCNKF